MEDKYGDIEELYKEAKKFVIKEQKANTSLIQRRLRIGYARAAHILDLLEERGVVGEYIDTTRREVLIKK